MAENLNTLIIECKKNPKHVKFTPTGLFSPINLPERFRSQLVWALIYHKARLTVMLEVNYISHNRPREFQGEYGVRNTGSGYVVEIDSRNPGCVAITIETAAHVVFDDVEAANTIAKFYFGYQKEVFQLGPARLLAVNPRMDVSRIIFTIDLKSVKHYGNDLSNLEYALSPSILPDINNGINNSLFQSVVVRYKTHSFSLLSFLFKEISCLKNIKFVSDVTCTLEIEIQISHVLLYDVILLIMAVASHHDRLIELFKDIGGQNVTNMETVQRPFITFRKDIEINHGNISNSTSKLPLSRFIEMDTQAINIVNSDFKIQQNETLFRLITCFSQYPIDIGELNIALKHFCQFDILSRLKWSDHIVFEIPVTSVNLLNRMSLEVNLHDVKVEEEHDNIAVLVSHPHEMPQQITMGKLEDSRTHRIVHTAPSCKVSSGGPVWVIPRELTSLEDIENIDAFTHSHVSGVPERGVGSRL